MTQEIRKILGIFALAFSIAFFALGMYFPILATHIKVVFKFSSKEFNIFDSVKLFFNSDNYFSAGVIILFSFVMPATKHFNLIICILENTTSQTLQNLDKWNMLDVFFSDVAAVEFQNAVKHYDNGTENRNDIHYFGSAIHNINNHFNNEIK